MPQKKSGEKKSRAELTLEVKILQAQVEETSQALRGQVAALKEELAAENADLKQQLAAERAARAEQNAALEQQVTQTQIDAKRLRALEGSIQNRKNRVGYLQDVYNGKKALRTSLDDFSETLRADPLENDKPSDGLKENIAQLVNIGLLNTDSTQPGLGGLRYSPKALSSSLEGISTNPYFQKLAIDGLPEGTTFDAHVQKLANEANLTYYLADQVGRTPLGKISVGKAAKEKTEDLKGLAGEIISLADGQDKVGLQAKVDQYITRAAQTRNGDIYIPSAGENSEHTKSLQGLMTLVNAVGTNGEPVSLANLRASVFTTLKVDPMSVDKLTPEHFTPYLESKRGEQQLYSIPSDFDIGLERRVLRHEKKIPDNQKQALKTSGSADLFATSQKSKEDLRKDIQSYLKVASAEPQKFGGGFADTSPNQYSANYTKYKEDTRAMEALVKALENPHNEVLRANFAKAYNVQAGQDLITEVKKGFAADLKEFSKVRIKELGSHLTRDKAKQGRINALAEKIENASTPEKKEAAFKDLVTEAAGRRQWGGLSSDVKEGSKGISKSTTSVGNLIDLLEKDEGLREQLGIKGKTGTELKKHVFGIIDDLKGKEESAELQKAQQEAQAQLARKHQEAEAKLKGSQQARAGRTEAMLQEKTSSVLDIWKRRIGASKPERSKVDNIMSLTAENATPDQHEAVNSIARAFKKFQVKKAEKAGKRDGESPDTSAVVDKGGKDKSIV